MAIPWVSNKVASSYKSHLGPPPEDNTVRNPPFVKTPPEVVDQMLELVDVEKDELLYDLGCGDGRIAMAAAKKFGCRAIGFDIEPEIVEIAKNQVTQNNLEDLVEIRQRDVLTLDLSQADVIMMYLLPKFNRQLIPQLQKLKPGTRIVSHEYGIGDIKPDREVKVMSETDGSEHTLFLWIAPLEIAE